MLGDNIGDLWDNIVPLEAPTVERSAVVVLAPSGVGKTAELSSRASHLREAGVTAFFLSAVDIATFGVVGAMADASAFRAWKDTDHRAVFFLDAVDEARLAGHDLARVLVRFAQEVDPATKRVQVVLSSRNDIWTPEDERLVVRLLSLPTDNPPVRVLRLEPLSLEDVKQYAKSNGVAEVDTFVNAIRQDELEQVLVDVRPPDARGARRLLEQQRGVRQLVRDA